jgi:hypothetical protein
MHQQLWGYKVEEKLYLGVSEQKTFELHWSILTRQTERAQAHTCCYMTQCEQAVETLQITTLRHLIVLVNRWICEVGGFSGAELSIRNRRSMEVQ